MNMVLFWGFGGIFHMGHDHILQSISFHFGFSNTEFTLPKSESQRNGGWLALRFQSCRLALNSDLEV